MSQDRLRQINEILRDLEDLKKRGFENMYALDENINFFEAMRSPVKYIKWFLHERPRIDGTRLLELSDFPFGHHRWEEVLQRELLEIEQWKFPDNLMRLRKSMLTLLEHLSSNKRRLVILNLGCGPMELERQVISNFLNKGNMQRIVFIGIDMSDFSLDLAMENLKSAGIPVQKISLINTPVLHELSKKYINNQFYAILLRGDVLSINRYFTDGDIDLIFYTKFRHHLTDNQKLHLDKIIADLSDHIIEDDLLNNLFMFLLPLVVRSQWRKPILLNGGAFSSLRCPSRVDVKKLDPGWSIKLTPDGYTKVYDACVK